MNRSKRVVTAALSTVSISVLLFGYHTSTAGPLASARTGVQSPVSASGSGSGAASSGSGAGTGSGTSKTQTVTGPVVQTQWGPVQVRISTRGSRITDVSVLQYPASNGRDQQINSYALPILVQSTMSAQSANIDMVSGATVTSTGYLESLQAALDQAGL